MTLRYFIVTQFVIQVTFAFSSPRGFGCQNVQSNFLSRQLRTNRCRRQDNPPLGSAANENTIDGFTNSLPFKDGMPFGNVPFRNVLPSGFTMNNGLPNGLPVNNGLQNNLPVNNGLPNFVPINNGFSNGLFLNNGMQNSLPINNRLSNGLPVNNFPNGETLNNGLPNGFGLNKGLTNTLPMSNRFSLNFPPGNGFPTNIPNPNINNVPTNEFFSGPNNEFLNSAPNGLPINNSPLNGFQNFNSGIANNFPNFNDLPGNNIIPNANNMAIFNNLQNDPHIVDGILGKGQAIQSGLSNNFQNTFSVNNGLPVTNNPQINNSPDGLLNSNLPSTNTFPIPNELLNLNNMQFTFIPRRFDNVPDNSFFNSNNNANVVQYSQSNAAIQPYNNFQSSNFMVENAQLAPLNGFSNYMPTVNYSPVNAMNAVPTYNNWGIANSLPTRNLPLVSPEMFINNLQPFFDTPNLSNQLPSGGLPSSYMPIDFQTVLPNNPGLNSLRIEGFGNLPIINGLPVAGITETVTLLNGQYN